MKRARALAGCGVILAAAIFAARADDEVYVPSSLPAATDPIIVPPPANAPAPASAPAVSGIAAPTTQSFPVATQNTPPPDPTDIGTADPERIAEETYLMNEGKQQDDVSADFDKAARRQAYDNDWMMRGYAEQLKKRGLGESKEINSVLIADPNAPSSIVSRDEALLGMPDNTKKAPQRHKFSAFNDSESLVPKKSLVTGSYQPLLKPFDQGAAPQAQAHWDLAASSFDSGLSDLETSSGATLLPVPGTIPDGIGRRNSALPGANGEDSLLDIPGLTAATQGAIAPNNALTFQDPGENETTSPQHPRTSASSSNFMLPTVPTNDISEFFKKQADALRPPTAPNVTQALVAPNHQNLPITPEPLARPAQQSNMGMRLHVDDPFDILRR